MKKLWSWKKFLTLSKQSAKIVNVRGKAKGFPNKPPKGRKKGVLWLRRRWPARKLWSSCWLSLRLRTTLRLLRLSARFMQASLAPVWSPMPPLRLVSWMNRLLPNASLRFVSMANPWLASGWLSMSTVWWPLRKSPRLWKSPLRMAKPPARRTARWLPTAPNLQRVGRKSYPYFLPQS